MPDAGSVWGSVQRSYPGFSPLWVKDRLADLLVSLAGRVAKSGDTMTGPLVLPSDPTANLEAATKQYVDASSPVGSVLDYVGSSAPSGWALLNGQTLTNAQTVYPDLWAVAPTAWRSSSDLVLPDLRGRATIGAGQGSGLTNRALGTSGGAETHTLTTAEMPSHTHTQDAHQHNVADGGFPTVINFTASGANTASMGQAAGAGRWSASITATNQNTGGSGAHNNMQPFYALNKILKIV
jgi:microcystin-dependent protein